MGKFSDQKKRLDLRVNDIEEAAVELFDGYDRRMNHIQQQVDEEKLTRDSREDWILREIKEVRDSVKEMAGKIIIIEAALERLSSNEHPSLWMRLVRLFKRG